MVEIKGRDWLYIAGAGAILWLVLNNTKKVGENVITPLSETVKETTSVVNPLLSAAGKGAEIVTNPASWKYTSYTSELLKAPFTGSQSWELFKQQPSFATGINALFTNLGLYK